MVVMHRAALTWVLALATAGVTACGGQLGPGPLGNMAPRARLSSPLYAPINELVAFDASASFDPDGTVVEYTFSFSDGSQQVTQSTPEVTHVFPTAGAYEVAVVIRDNGGQLARVTQLVVVRSDPPPCLQPSDCAFGTECRDRLCYATGTGAGLGVADCKIDNECNTGFTCRAGLCLSVQTGVR